MIARDEAPFAAIAATLDETIAAMSARLDAAPRILKTSLASHADGIACVIGTGDIDADTFPSTSRVRALSPELSKGLEFDLVVLIDPEALGTGFGGAVDRYVAMTRRPSNSTSSRALKDPVATTDVTRTRSTVAIWLLSGAPGPTRSRQSRPGRMPVQVVPSNSSKSRVLPCQPDVRSNDSPA